MTFPESLSSGVDVKEKFSIRPKFTGSHTLILIGIGFSLVYWVLESVRDTFVFHRGTLVQRIFLPDSMGFYMRLLVVCIIILFSVQAQSARNRTESKQDEKPSSWKMYSIILSGFAFGAFYWLLEAFRDAFIFNRGGLWERIVSPDPIFIWMRLLAVCIIVLFSIYAQSLVNARKMAEWALQKKTGDLEKSVRERTADLTRSNLLLRQEIMERQQRERELRIMESAIDSSINAICMVDLDGRGTYINPAFAGLWKTTVDEAVGQKSVDFWADKQQTAGILKQLGEKKSWIGELDALARDGTVFPVQVSMNVVQDHEGKPMCMMGSFLDISQRRAAEAEKESMQAQLIQAQKMEAVGVLTGGIAHDFNNFLTAIQVSCDLAMMQVDEGQPLYSDLNEIHGLTSKAADLIRQLLLFSRKHHMEF
ncbi:MAG TPA: PAS domain S-box protein, partial [bacterium]|nr:PAS domain S-box protein [bacterium]